MLRNLTSPCACACRKPTEGWRRKKELEDEEMTKHIRISQQRVCIFKEEEYNNDDEHEVHAEAEEEQENCESLQGDRM
jgi:hypothetical protein